MKKDHTSAFLIKEISLNSEIEEKGFLMNILTFDLEEWHHLLDIKLDLQKNKEIILFWQLSPKIYWKSLKLKIPKQLFFA